MTLQEQLFEVEQMIENSKALGPRYGNRRVDALQALAADLRARIKMPPSLVLYEFERRLAAVRRPGVDRHGAILGCGEELAARWPLVRRALEKYGEDVEA